MEQFASKEISSGVKDRVELHNYVLTISLKMLLG